MDILNKISIFLDEDALTALAGQYKKSSGFEKDKIVKQIKGLTKKKEDLKKKAAKIMGVNPYLLRDDIEKENESM